MPKLILTSEAQSEVAYEFAECSITIGRAPDNMIVIEDPYRRRAGPMRSDTASPFRQKATVRDPWRIATFGVATIAILAFFGSMIAVLTMHALTP